MYALEPVIFKDNPAASTDRSSLVVIVRPVVRAVGDVVAVARIFLESLHLHPVYGIEDGFADECRDTLYHVISVLYVEVDAALD